MCAIFHNFSIAFDTVPHKKLCLKLDHIGIWGKLTAKSLCGWLPSQWSSVLSGLPQESILGLLLFLIHMCQWHYWQLNSPTEMFADDGILLREIKCRQSQLQNDLTRILTTITLCNFLIANLSWKFGMMFTKGLCLHRHWNLYWWKVLRRKYHPFWTWTVGYLEKSSNVK